LQGKRGAAMPTSESSDRYHSWMPEIGLGIGYDRGNYGGVIREWLYWYDEDGKRYLTPNERVQAEVDRSNKLADKLRQLGIDPDDLSNCSREILLVCKELLS
jgi:hypothetical protein